MNTWQKSFLTFGVIATAALFLFPPQITPNRDVLFLYVMNRLPVDWLRLFLWFLGILLVTGLGVAVNKEEHN